MTSNKKLWVYGKHAAIAALGNNLRKIYKAFLTIENFKALEKLLKARQIPYTITTNKQLDSFVGAISHQGIALDASPIFKNDLHEIAPLLKREKSILLFLDQLTDIQNVGNIIRSAYAFKVDAVLTTKDHSFSETPALAKAACGALDKVPVIAVTNLASTLKHLKDSGYWIAGLDSHAPQLIQNFEFPSKIALIVGSEDTGLRNLTKQNCDFLLKINIRTNSDSINASSACAIATHYAMLHIYAD